MPRKKKQKRSRFSQLLRIFLFLLLIAVISSSITLTMYTTFAVKETKTIPYYFIVEENLVGMDTSKDPLSFGGMPPGGSGKRQIVLRSDTPVRVVITAEGDGSEYIYATENSFILLPNENKTLTVYAAPPLDAEEKRYEGTLRIFFIHPRLGTRIQGVAEGGT